MKISVADLLAALVPAILAGLGGALAVHAAYDDAPGATLFGLLLILGAAALGLRTAQRGR